MLKGDSISVNKADAKPVVMSELTAWTVDSLYSQSKANCREQVDPLSSSHGEQKPPKTEVLHQTRKKSFVTFFDVTSTLIAQS